jgi:glycosyltransferase involved in cell wall biosynthesis
MSVLPFVTVLIDTYNYGAYVEEAVRSALAQEYPRERREIVVVDDGSTDDTPARLRKFGESIRYFRKPNGGQASAFNFGFEQARGEIVAFLDADDVWLPGKLRRMARAFEDYPNAGLVYHRFIETRAGSAPAESSYAVLSGFLPPNRNMLLNYPIYPTSTLAFRRWVLERLFPIPPGLSSQADAFIAGLAVFLAPVVGLVECLALYRVHERNAFHMPANGGSAERIACRMNASQAVHSAARQWLAGNGHDPAAELLSAYLARWTFAQKQDRFQIQAPDRWTLFNQQWREARLHRGLRTPRHRMVTYMNAVGSLVVGYRNLHRLDEWRLAGKQMFRGPWK